jgi:hypothetical protein
VCATRGLAVVTATPPDAPTHTLVAAFDEASGQPMWQARLDAVVRPYPVAQGDAVALWCVARARGRSAATVQVLDLLSGAPRFTVELGDASLQEGTPPVFLPDGTLGVVIEGGELRGYDADTGALAWQHDLGDGGVLGELLVGATQVVVRRAPVVGGDLAPALSAIDLRTRARRWDLPVRDLQRAPLLLAGDDLLLVRTLPDRRLVCECWDARDGRTLRWRGELGPAQAQCSRLLVALDHVVAVVNTPRAVGGRLDVHAVVFERHGGKLVQEPIAPGGEYDQPPLAVLAGDGTVVLQTGGLLAGIGTK